MVEDNASARTPQLVSTCSPKTPRLAMVGQAGIHRWVSRPVRVARCCFAAAVTDRRGVSAAEYAILTVAIVIVVGTAVVTLNDPTNSAFVILGNAITSAQASLAGAR